MKWTDCIFHNCCLVENDPKGKAGQTQSTAVNYEQDGNLESPIAIERAPSFGAFTSRQDSEVLKAADTLLPSILETFSDQLTRVCEKNVLDMNYIDSLSQRAERSIASEAHVLTSVPHICDPTSPGYVMDYVEVPVNHSLGFWVWRPRGVDDGIIIVKSGPKTKPGEKDKQEVEKRMD